MKKIAFLAILTVFIIISFVIVSANNWCDYADIDRDGQVGPYENNLINDNWGRTDCSEDNSWCGGADVNKDGQVGPYEMNLFSDYYGRTDCGATCDDIDLNDDGVVNDDDYSVLEAKWGNTDCSNDNNWCSKVDINRDGEVGPADMNIYSDKIDECAETPECPPGDMNGDGKVDGADLAIWQQDYTISGDYCGRADLNNDGNVDSEDKEIWDENYDPLGIGECKLPALNCIPTQTQTCTDSDGGKNYYEKGITKWTVGNSINKKDDYCVDVNVLSEGYCLEEEDENGKRYRRITYECPNGCEDGVCIREEQEQIKEQITCKFENIEDTNKKQQCYLAGQWNNDDEGTKFCYADPETGSCVIEYESYKGEQVTWKSTCGQYQYTTQDGQDEVIYFKCEVGETTITEVQNKGFKNVYFQCYDGAESKSTEREACKTADYWKKFAENFCESHCKKYKDVEKCGVNTFSLTEECYLDLEDFPVVKEEEESKEKPALICKDSCALDEKCYPFGYRKAGRYCSDEGNFVEQLEGEETCDNNFECKSNVCVAGKCVSQGLLEKIIAWFKRLFGME